MEEETGVYLSSPTNSTTFTNCCGTAIGCEARCPKCNKLVVGHEIEDPDETKKFRFNYAY